MKKKILIFLLLLFSILPFSFSSSISVDATDDVITIDFFSKSLQLLDLENWFYYDHTPSGPDYRTISLSGYEFILESNIEHTFVLNKSIFREDPFSLDAEDDYLFGDQFYIVNRSENIDYIFYTVIPEFMDISIGENWYHVVDYFKFEFVSRNFLSDSTMTEVLEQELKQLMILHKGLPYDTYILEDFEYEHPFDETDNVINIDYFSKSLQLLDLENWFYYRAKDLGTFSRKISLSGYQFILDSYKEYTLVLNKSIIANDPFNGLGEGYLFWGQFYIENRYETDDYIFYTIIPTKDHIVINGRWYQVIDYFEFEFESRYDATLEPDILDYELSQLMILHEGYPKDTYNLEDFKYKHPLHDRTPVFDGDTYFVTNVNNPFTLEQILSHIVVWDDEDGYIDPVLVEDNYSSNRNQLGSYIIKLQASDSSGNTSELVITVLVIDVDAPEIIGPAEIQVSITKKLSVEEIKSKFKVADNYDVVLSLSIIENDYLNNWNKVGRYKVVLKAVDSSENETIREIYIKVVDDVAPVIIGPTNIVKNNNEVLTITDILSLFTVTDNVDSDITKSLVVVSDGYTGNGHKVGEYKVVLAVTDTSGNEARHEVIIKVLDKIPPVFYIDNFLINVQSGVVLTKQQIVDLLISTGQLEANGITYVNFVLNEYEGNERVPGIYNLKLSTVSTDGSEKAFDLQVKVLEVEDNINPIIVETKNFFEKVWKHILENWYWYLLGLIFLFLILKRRSFRRY